MLHQQKDSILGLCVSLSNDHCFGAREGQGRHTLFQAPPHIFRGCLVQKGRYADFGSSQTYLRISGSIDSAKARTIFVVRGAASLECDKSAHFRMSRTLLFFFGNYIRTRPE
jgi:hypothetical protein